MHLHLHAAAEGNELKKNASHGDTLQLLPSAPTSRHQEEDSDSGESISVYESKNL